MTNPEEEAVDFIKAGAPDYCNPCHIRQLITTEWPSAKM